MNINLKNIGIKVPERETASILQSLTALMPFLFMETKICFKCGKEKPISKFYKDKKSKDGYGYYCKECQSKMAKEYYHNNLEKFKEYRINNRGKISQHQKEYYQNNAELLKEKGKKYYQDNLEKMRKKNKEYYWDNLGKHKEYGKKYRSNNRDKARQSQKEYMKRKRESDPVFKLNHNISTGIYNSLKGNKNGHHWEDLVGYSLSDLKNHLEVQFKDGITWQNYGKWHIDHIVAKSLFNIKGPKSKGFKKCWALENLRPMWAKENIKKKNKLFW